MTVKGMDEVMQNLRKEIKGIKNRTQAGMLAAGLKVMRLSQQRVPVEYGNLRGSAFARRAQNDEMAVEVGFSAHYAFYVHENTQMRLKGTPRPSGLGVYWGPKGQAKFLESAVSDLQKEIVDTIAAYAKVK